MVTSHKHKMISTLASGAVVSSIPVIQIGILYRFLWVPGQSESVNRNTCSCSCFDGVFKGSYEAGSRKHGYKHVYFNATYQTMCAWIITVLYILLGYEALKSFLSLLLSRSLRPVMAFLFCLSIYPHIFGWWALFNYYNDDFYPMFRHQIYFAITEVISSYAILRSCDSNVTRQIWLYGIVVGTAIVHLLVAGPEEFIVNLLHGKVHQFWRDVGLSSSDIANMILPFVEYRLFEHQNILGMPSSKSFTLYGIFSNRSRTVFAYCFLILVLGYLI